MRINKHILLNPDPAAGGGGVDWKASLPEDIRGEPSLVAIKDVGALAKSYVNAQRLIGTDKIALPKAGAPDTEWDAVWNKLGRPDAPEKYELPKDVKLHEGFKFDDAKLAETRKTFHKLGLTQAQGAQILAMYAGEMSGGLSAAQQKAEADTAAAATALKDLYGDKTTHRIDLAKSVVKNFGGEELLNHLESTGLGNSVPLIQMLVKIGDLMQEDKARGGNNGLIVGDATQALSEINSLKMDAEFTKALHTSNHPGHAAAVEKWSGLFKVAYPGKNE